MLDVKTNRMDYGEQLVPFDSSYELDFAVGTTYSLDLEAIMVLPVAMFYSRTLDCSPDPLHFDVLDALTQSANKIRVYCQKVKRVGIPEHRLTKILGLLQGLFTPLLLTQARTNDYHVRPLKTLFNRLWGKLVDHQLRPRGNNRRNVFAAGQHAY